MKEPGWWSKLPVFLMVTLVASMALGIGLIVASEEAVDPSTLEQALLRDLGLAFLVAGFLGSTYELVQRQHLMQQAERTIAKIREEQIIQTLRSLMTETVFEEIQDHIIRRPLIREYQKVTLILDWMPGTDRQYLKSRCTSRYKLRNLTEAPVEELVTAFCSRALSDLFPDACKISKVCIGDKVLEGEALPVQPQNEDYLQFTQRETIPPKGELQIECCYEGVHHSRDQWVWVFGQMTEKFELTLMHPADLEIEAQANHPRGNQRFDLVIPEEGLKEWELKAASLPGQSIQLAWHYHSASVSEEGR